MRNGTCFNVFCWIIQILVWLFLILTIVFFVEDVSAKIPVLILFIAFYIAYITLEFCSMVCEYLCHKTSENGIYQKISSYYRSYPVFQFYCECYHYELKEKREQEQLLKEFELLHIEKDMISLIIQNEMSVDFFI